MTEQRENISRLIEKVSRRTSTENLIAFVADNFGMLLACQKVVDFKETPDAAARTWFEQKCRDFRITPRVLQNECERLLSIFQPGLAQDEQYSLLGLTPLASIAEVKSAYHKLSFRYHPDSAAAGASGDNDNGEKFIAICRAYKKITQAQESLNADVDQAGNIPWQHELRPRVAKRRQPKRKAFFLITAIAAGLLIVTFSATRSYRNRAMLKSLGQSSGTAAVKSRPQPVPAHRLPLLRERVNIFLAAYTDTYEMLNFNEFAALFTDDARENDTSFKQISSKYHQLFGLLQKASYTIQPQSLRVDNNLVYVSGHFRASLLYRDGKELKVHGPTSLLLYEDPTHHFKVKNLTYTFD